MVQSGLVVNIGFGSDHPYAANVAAPTVSFEDQQAINVFKPGAICYGFFQVIAKGSFHYQGFKRGGTEVPPSE